MGHEEKNGVGWKKDWCGRKEGEDRRRGELGRGVRTNKVGGRREEGGKGG